MRSPSELHFFRGFGRVAGQLIALSSLLTMVANGCSDGVRTEPAFCPGGNAGTGGCGGSCGQNSGGVGGDTSTTGGTPSSAGESTGGASTGGSASGGEAGTPGAGGTAGAGGDAQAGGDAGGAAGSGQGGTQGGSGGSSAKGGSSGSSGSTAKGGAGGSAGSSSKGGAGGSTGGSSGSTSTGGSGGGTGCPRTLKNTTVDMTVDPPVAKAQDQECKAAYSVNECGKSCAQITPVACLTCETASTDCAPTTDCNIATGNASAGPAAGTSRAQLCREALACFRTSGCGKTMAVDTCYCGTSGATCYMGGANGPCKAEVEAGLETDVGGDVAARFGDPTYGAGLALLRLGCDHDICPTACFP